jgi:hypothetical protein
MVEAARVEAMAAATEVLGKLRLLCQSRKRRR